MRLQIAGIGPREQIRGRIAFFSGPVVGLRVHGMQILCCGCAGSHHAGDRARVACLRTLLRCRHFCSILFGDGRHTEKFSRPGKFSVNYLRCEICLNEVCHALEAQKASNMPPQSQETPALTRTCRLKKVASLSKRHRTGMVSCIRGDTAASTREAHSRIQQCQMSAALPHMRCRILAARLQARYRASATCNPN